MKFFEVVWGGPGGALGVPGGSLGAPKRLLGRPKVTLEGRVAALGALGRVLGP